MGMPGIWEILIIVLILIVIFGGNRSMSIIRDLGKEVLDLKKKFKDLDDRRK
jgi:Sec-independent protein translocase protein TatA